MTQNNNFDQILKGRKSIKVFDKNYKIPREEMDEIIEKATLAPSSVNMQPWRMVVVDTPEGKEKLRPLMSMNTRQNDTSSAMIVIFGDLHNYEHAEHIYGSQVERGFMTEEIKTQFLDWVVPYYKGLTTEQMTSIVNIDSSLMAMQLMLVAKAHGYDTNPIGGFDRANMAACFDMDPERYIPVMVIAIGKKAQEGHSSYRMPVDAIRQYF